MRYRLDTAAIERITTAGADPALARTIVAEIARADESATAAPATKSVLAALEGRLIKWAIGTALAVAGLLFAALRLTGGSA